MRHRELIEQWAARFDRGDIAGMMELALPDIELAMPGTEMKGRENLAPLLQGLHTAFPDLHHHQVRYLESENTVVVELILTGTMTGSLPTPHGIQPPSGRKLNMRACDVVTVRDGRLAAISSYFDNVEFMTALGLMSNAG